MSIDFAKARNIFHSALQHNGVERDSFLVDACGEDMQLREHIDRLLQGHQKSGAFLEQGAIGITQDPSGSINIVGTQIGPYKIREKIGEGGFGVVYVAEQKEPVSRKVALKVIKPGMDSKEIIARFMAERQALAIMDHPNVARVLDAGATESGRPYFVMELVRGVAITEYCDSKKLTNLQRLELFIDACNAVQHSHQKGIIHRDIKPSNIMVAKADHRAIVKVIDFGVAKALHSDLTDRSIYTGYGQMIGTPMYMSPEQAELSSLDIDTRSDIYSLGVLLYELLTGTTPFDKETFKNAGFDEVRRMIREVEPHRPSDRVSTLHAGLQSTVSEKRKIDQRSLSRSLRGELDLIILKAMEKDRTRRYETVSGFADDVQRYLNDEPVLACPPSTVYRLRKFASQNKSACTLTVLTGLFLLVGIIGLGLSTYLLAESEQKTKFALQRATENEQKANKRLAQLVNGNEIITSIFADLDLRAFREGVDPLESILAKRLISAGQELSIADSVGDPLVIAAMHQKIGEALLSLGFAEDSAELFNKSWETRKEILGREHEDSIESMLGVGESYLAIGQTGEAVIFLEETLALASSNLGVDHFHTLKCMGVLAHGYYNHGQSNESLSLLQELIQLNTEKFGIDHESTHVLMSNLANIYLQLGQSGKALSWANKALELRSNEFPDHPDTLNVMHTTGRAYLANGQVDKAIEMMEKTVKLKEAKLGYDHPHTLISNTILATAYKKAKRTDEALELSITTLNLMKTKLPIDHPETIQATQNLASLYWSMKRPDKSIPLFEEALVQAENKLGRSEFVTLMIIANLGINYKGTGRLDEAIPLLEEATEAISRFPKLRFARESLKQAYSMAGQKEKFAKIATEDLEDAISTSEPESMELAGHLARLGLLKLVLEENSQAEDLLRECLAIRIRKAPDDWLTFNAQSMLGEALSDQQKHTEAEPLLINGYEGMIDRMQMIPDSSRFRLTDSLRRLITLYWSWNIDEPNNGHDESAVFWQKKLDEFHEMHSQENSTNRK